MNICFWKEGFYHVKQNIRYQQSVLAIHEHNFWSVCIKFLMVALLHSYRYDRASNDSSVLRPDPPCTGHGRICFKRFFPLTQAESEAGHHSRTDHHCVRTVSGTGYVFMLPRRKRHLQLFPLLFWCDLCFLGIYFIIRICDPGTIWMYDKADFHLGIYVIH